MQSLEVIPQLHDRVTVYIQTYIHSIDAFQTEFCSTAAPFPLTKSSVAIISLVKSLCKAIELIPVNQGECVQIIEDSLTMYYEKCVKKFYGLSFFLLNEHPVYLVTHSVLIQPHCIVMHRIRMIWT